MLSGVGPADHLKSLGIPLVADRPGVGRNLVEHVATTGLHFTVDKDSALNYPKLARRREEFLTQRTGPLMILGGVEAMGFIRTKYANASAGCPDCPDVQYHFVTISPSTEYSGFQSMNFKEDVSLLQIV